MALKLMLSVIGEPDISGGVDSNGDGVECVVGGWPLWNC